MKEQDINDEVRKLKQEATALLDKMFKIPEGFSSGVNERIVECIVSAAVLASTSILAEALRLPKEVERDDDKNMPEVRKTDSTSKG